MARLRRSPPSPATAGTPPPPAARPPSPVTDRPLPRGRLGALILVVPILAALFSGCANRSLVRFEKIAKAAAGDDYLEAARSIRKDKDLYGSHSGLR